MHLHILCIFYFNSIKPKFKCIFNFRFYHSVCILFLSLFTFGLWTFHFVRRIGSRGRRIHVSNLYFCTRPLCQFNHRGVNVWILIMQDMAVDPFWSMGIMSSQKVTEHSQKPILCCSGEVGNI